LATDAPGGKEIIAPTRLIVAASGETGRVTR